MSRTSLSQSHSFSCMIFLVCARQILLLFSFFFLFLSLLGHNPLKLDNCQCIHLWLQHCPIHWIHDIIITSHVSFDSITIVYIILGCIPTITYHDHGMHIRYTCKLPISAYTCMSFEINEKCPKTTVNLPLWSSDKCNVHSLDLSNFFFNFWTQTTFASSHLFWPHLLLYHETHLHWCKHI